MSELPEIALTKEEIDRLLHSCNGRALLVGGQSLAFWAQHYQIRLQGVLADGVTRDADFIGTAAVAREIYASLRPLGWRFGAFRLTMQQRKPPSSASEWKVRASSRSISSAVS